MKGLGKLRAAVALSLVTATAACGDGSGSGTPTPTPTPTPAPTPTPTPTPAPTGRVFSAVAAPCFIYIYTTADRIANSDFSGRYCARDGTFGPSVTGFQGAAFGTNFTFSFDRHYLTATGVESAGATYFQFTAPLGSKVLSPVTSLIDKSGSQAAVKRALGLDSGIFALSTNPDLTQFDAMAALASTTVADQQEGARVAAANLRALAVALGVSVVASQGQFDTGGIEIPDYAPIGTFIGSGGTFLFNNTTMTQLVTSRATPGRYSPEVLSAAAHLIDAYCAAIGVQVADRNAAAQFTMGAYGYLRFELAKLLRTNTLAAANAAQAITSPMILTETAIYRDPAPFPTSGTFFPLTDFYLIRSSDPATSLPIAAYDMHANGPTGSIGFFTGPPTSQILSVSVPASAAGKIAVTFNPNQAFANAIGGFTGTTYFEYTVQHDVGQQATGRVYLHFW